MYKRQTLIQLFETNNNFIKNLSYVINKERAQTLVNLVKIGFKMGDSVYYLMGSDPYFRMQKINDNEYMLISETERIELKCDSNDIKRLSALVSNPKKVKQSDKSILDILMDEFLEGQYETINGKPYITYDVETLLANDETLHLLEFELGYAINSSDCKEGADKVNKYIAKENLKKFTDYLLEYDGYIVGFNNLAFDNKVIVYQAGYGQAEIDKLNAKTIDIFMFLRNKINKRIGLNKVATAMVGLAKNLDIAGDGIGLLQDWLKNANTESLEKVKKYCKNDVKMTLGILLYFIKYQEFYIDGEKVEFTIDEMLELAVKDRNKKKEIKSQIPSQKNSLFG